METLVFLGMIYAACGLVISLVVHVKSLLGDNMGNVDKLFFALHIGIFPVFAFMTYLFGKALKGVQGWAAAEIMLSGCPAWMRYMVYGFFAYALVNFAIMFIPPWVASSPAKLDPPWRGFSGHWMLFYAAALAGLTTAYTRGVDNLRRKCALGHDLDYDDNFCPTCGRPTPRK